MIPLGATGATTPPVMRRAGNVVFPQNTTTPWGIAIGATAMVGAEVFRVVGAERLEGTLELVPGGGAIAASGDIRAENNRTHHAARNAANTNDLPTLSTDAGDGIILGDPADTNIELTGGFIDFDITGAVRVLRLSGGNTTMAFDTLQYGVGEASVVFRQENDTAVGATGAPMLMHAQDVTGGGASTGGELAIRSGNGATLGELLFQAGDGSGIARIPATGDHWQWDDVDVRFRASLAGPGLYHWQDETSAAAAGEHTEMRGQNSTGAGATTGGNALLRGGTGATGGNAYLIPAGGATAVGQSQMRDSADAVKFAANTTGIGFFGTPPVARPAAYVVTNPTDRRSYDTTTITLPQLAEVVGTIIADRQAYGDFQ